MYMLHVLVLLAMPYYACTFPAWRLFIAFHACHAFLPFPYLHGGGGVCLCLACLSQHVLLLLCMTFSSFAVCAGHYGSCVLGSSDRSFVWFYWVAWSPLCHGNSAQTFGWLVLLVVVMVGSDYNCLGCPFHFITSHYNCCLVWVLCSAHSCWVWLCPL